MTIQATDLVGSRMNFMREKDRLLRLIILLTAQPDGGLYNIISTNYKENKDHECEIDLITIKWNGIMGWNTGFIIGKFPQIAVNLQKHQHDHGQYQGKNSVQETVIGFQRLCCRTFIRIFSTDRLRVPDRFQHTSEWHQFPHP